MEVDKTEPFHVREDHRLPVIAPFEVRPWCVYSSSRKQANRNAPWGGPQLVSALHAIPDQEKVFIFPDKLDFFKACRVKERCGLHAGQTATCSCITTPWRTVRKLDITIPYRTVVDPWYAEEYRVDTCGTSVCFLRDLILNGALNTYEIMAIFHAMLHNGNAELKCQRPLVEDLECAYRALLRAFRHIDFISCDIHAGNNYPDDE